jgi:outer membrane protein assembly factor BamD
LYAKNSSEFKQEDRYNQAITFSDQFAEKYPNSKYLKEGCRFEKGIANTALNRNKQVLAEALNDAKHARKLAKKDSAKP